MARFGRHAVYQSFRFYLYPRLESIRHILARLLCFRRMWIELLLLLGGLALIVRGGDLFVAAAIRVAEFLCMPRVVIGSTLVSLATTTPELVVSIMAGMRGESGLAVGNAVGSCICNIGLILGITATIKHVDVHFRSLRTPLLAMFGFGVLLFVMTLDLSLERWQGGVLIVGGLAYFAWNFWQHWCIRKPEDIAEATAIEAEKLASGSTWVQTKTGTAAQFLLGTGLVVIGSRLLVDGAVGAVSRLGVPPIVIGLTVDSADHRRCSASCGSSSAFTMLHDGIRSID